MPHTNRFKSFEVVGSLGVSGFRSLGLGFKLLGFKGLGVRGANFGRASNFRQSNPESFRVGSPIPDEEQLQWTQKSIYSNKLYALRALRMWGLAWETPEC